MCPTAGVACPSDKQIRHIHDLPKAIPWLWEGQQPPAVLAASPALPSIPPGADGADASSHAEAVVAKAKATVTKRTSTDGASSEGAIEAVYVAA